MTDMLEGLIATVHTPFTAEGKLNAVMVLPQARSVRAANGIHEGDSTMPRLANPDFIVGKAIMRWLGLDCGPVRPPLKNLTDDEYRYLVGELEQMDFLQYASSEMEEQS